MSGKITVVGLGPGNERMITPAVTEAITAADVVVGYCGYMAFIEHIIPGQAVRISSGMTQEVRRAEKAFVLAHEGKSVVVVSSGDAGIYGMAPLIMEMYAKAESDDVDVEVLPGISAFQAAAARLGAPISHDFCVISLSDLMTPWEKIEARINAAASADFVTAVYNPKSRDRFWQIHRFREIFLQKRVPETPVGIVRNVDRDSESVVLTTLGEFDPDSLDMFSVMLVGNDSTFFSRNRMITPRGYFDRQRAEENKTVGQSIMNGSFRKIVGMLKKRDLAPDHAWALMHVIHTTADFELENLFHTSPGAVERWFHGLTAGGAVIVTDVTMVQSGIRKAALKKYGITVCCYLSDPRVPEMAAKHGITRSQAGIRLAAGEHPDALFVVGNAPTALMELASLLNRTDFSPMGVIGAPVGFVNVVESKHRLNAAAGSIPIAVTEGRKGGSSIAATIVNAALSFDDAVEMFPGRYV